MSYLFCSMQTGKRVYGTVQGSSVSWCFDSICSLVVLMYTDFLIFPAYGEISSIKIIRTNRFFFTGYMEIKEPEALIFHCDPYFCKVIVLFQSS